MVCAGGVKGEDSCQVRTKMVSQVLYREGECTTVDFQSHYNKTKISEMDISSIYLKRRKF